MSIPASYTTYWDTFWTRYSQVLTIIRGLSVEPHTSIAELQSNIDTLQWNWAQTYWTDPETNRSATQVIVDRLQQIINIMNGYLSQTFYQWIDAFQTIFDNRLEAAFTKLDQAVDVVVAYVDSEVSRLETLVALNIDNLYTYVDTEIDQVYVDMNLINAEIYADMDAAETRAKEYAAGLVNGVYTYVDTDIDQVYADISAIVDQIYIDMQAGMGVDESWVNAQIAAAAAALQQNIDTLEALTNVQIAALSTEFDAFKADISQEIDLAVTTLNNYVNEQLGYTNTAITQVQQNLNQAIAQVNTDMDTKIQAAVDQLHGDMLTLREVLEGEITDVAESIAEQLAVVTDFALYAYNYSFFGLELPEIGLLNMVNRDDAHFDRFKDFYRLLFSRILSTG